MPTNTSRVIALPSTTSAQLVRCWPPYALAVCSTDGLKVFQKTNPFAHASNGSTTQMLMLRRRHFRPFHHLPINARSFLNELVVTEEQFDENKANKAIVTNCAGHLNHPLAWAAEIHRNASFP